MHRIQEFLELPSLQGISGVEVPPVVPLGLARSVKSCSGGVVAFRRSAGSWCSWRVALIWSSRLPFSVEAMSALDPFVWLSRDGVRRIIGRSRVSVADAPRDSPDPEGISGRGVSSLRRTGVWSSAELSRLTCPRRSGDSGGSSSGSPMVRGESGSEGASSSSSRAAAVRTGLRMSTKDCWSSGCAPT